MKINKNYAKASIFIAVYLFAIYIWTLPFQDANVPYGEWDAISHWELADFIAQRDQTFSTLPKFLDYSYGNDNQFKPHTLWYHPPFHVDMAIISAFANDRMIPIFLTNAIFASSILISVFFVINRLFGFLPGILSAFMLIFSMRDILPYLWGQWPERFAYAFIPLILYCFYMYFTNYSNENRNPAYLYIMAILLGANLYIHPLVMFHSIIGIFVLVIILAIKQRKFPLNLKHIGISFFIFLIMAAVFPLQTGNVILSFAKSSTDEDKKYAPISTLLRLGPDPDNFVGSVPRMYFSFEKMIGYWGFLDENTINEVNTDSNLFKKIKVNFTNLIFISFLLGIIVTLYRRGANDLFLLAWLISFYLIMHRDIIGISTFLHRSFSAAAHIIIPIAVIGALQIYTILKIPEKLKQTLKYISAAAIIILTLKFNMPTAYATLDNAYDSPLLRINGAQVEASEWLKANIDENANVSVIGPFPDIMQKAWWMASYSHRTSFFFEGFILWPSPGENANETAKYHILNDYVLFDYTDIGLLSGRSLVDKWLNFEKLNMENHKLLYNKDNIRVYKYEAS